MQINKIDTNFQRANKMLPISKHLVSLKNNSFLYFLLLSICSDQSALNVVNSKTISRKLDCGRVPIYEKTNGLSISKELIEIKEIDEDAETRILYGIDAVQGEWPWIVRLRECKRPSRCRMCTGTVLNSRWIISAGHCFNNQTSVDMVEVTLGLYDLIERDKIAKDFKLEKVIVHPNWTSDLDNDLALLRLSEEIKFGKFIQPACLLSKNVRDLPHFSKSRICYAVGYGMIVGMNEGINLQKLSITARNPKECNSEMESIHLRNNTVCVGPRKDIGSSCKGDSGGPNVCYDHLKDRWYLFGLVSYGPSNCDREEGDKWLSVATDLSKFREWILSVISTN